GHGRGDHRVPAARRGRVAAGPVGRGAAPWGAGSGHHGPAHAGAVDADVLGGGARSGPGRTDGDPAVAGRGLPGTDQRRCGGGGAGAMSRPGAVLALGQVRHQLLVLVRSPMGFFVTLVVPVLLLLCLNLLTPATVA